MAQVSPHEVGMSQVGPTQISVAEIGLTQIGVDLRMLSSPRILRRDSLLENSEVLLICHRVSLLFECCSHYMALEETLQGHSAHSLTKTSGSGSLGAVPRSFQQQRRNRGCLQFPHVRPYHILSLALSFLPMSELNHCSAYLARAW